MTTNSEGPVGPCGGPGDVGSSVPLSHSVGAPIGPTGEKGPAGFKNGPIMGLFVKDLQVNVDDRGILVELLRDDWEDEFFNKVSLKQIYLVQNTQRAVRAFHKHEFLVDYFCIIKGSAKFIFIDDRQDRETYGNLKIVNVTDQRLQMITVPVGVYHGWTASEGTILISGANQLYLGEGRKGKLDEERIPWDLFGPEIWGVQNK